MNEPYSRKVRVPRSLAKAIEIKHVDSNNVGFQAVTNSWKIGSIGPLLAQGVDGGTRIGRKVKVVHLSLKIRVVPVLGTSPVLGLQKNTETVHIVVWWDKENKGQVSAAIADIYETTNTTSFPNASWTKRFVQIGENYMQVTPIQLDGTNTWGIAASCAWNMEFEIPFPHGLEVNFSGAGGTMSSIIDNAFYVTYCGQNTTTCAMFECDSRISYIDI